MTREEKLEKLQRVLADLNGFAERNMLRSICAQTAAEEQLAQMNDEDARTNLAVQTARVHEAQRFLLVVRERIAEARA